MLKSKEKQKLLLPFIIYLNKKKNCKCTLLITYLNFPRDFDTEYLHYLLTVHANKMHNFQLKCNLMIIIPTLTFTDGENAYVLIIVCLMEMPNSIQSSLFRLVVANYIKQQKSHF